MVYARKHDKDETWITVSTFNYYIRNPTICIITGLIMGWITLAIGVYTDWYYFALLSLWTFFFVDNLPLGLFCTGLFALMVFILYKLRPKKKKIAPLRIWDKEEEE